MYSGDPSGTILINGRYRILHPLQEGGFGHTFLAEDTQLPSKRKCVVKRLKPMAENPDIYQLIQERFQREAAIQERLGEVCDQIPRLYAHFSEGEHFYLIEQWIEGPTLTQKIKDVGRFSDAAVRELLVQILSIVDVVHQHQMIHRDIKPDNIIIRQQDNKPVLIDFGAVKETMATIVNSQGETARSIVIGTPGYMAPEQSAGRPLYASDIYGVGLTGIYLVTGKMPAELPSDPVTGAIAWRSLAPHVGNSLADALDKAVAVQPQDRFASAQYMRQILQGVSANNPLVNEPTISRNPAYPPQSAPSMVSTQVVSPAATAVTPPQTITPATPTAQPVAISKQGFSNEWIKALILGGCIGGAILGAVLLLKPKPQFTEVQPSPIASSSPSSPVSPSPNTQPTEPNPVTSSTQPKPSNSTPSPQPVTAAATCGDPVGSATTWYPVFINNANVEQVRTRDCQDAIAKTRDDGTPTVQVASFNSREKAEAFAQKVGGDVGTPYQVAGTTVSPSSNPSPANSPPVASADGTDAVITGDSSEKNIRQGPGTDYGVQHIAYPGDRVKIQESSIDKGGYTWYKVYFPKSGASGWIAGQLVRRDN